MAANLPRPPYKIALYLVRSFAPDMAPYLATLLFSQLTELDNEGPGCNEETRRELQGESRQAPQYLHQRPGCSASKAFAGVRVDRGI
jgi:hypothetical protein